MGLPVRTYCPRQLAQWACDQLGWTLEEVHFYTGIHEAQRNPFLHYYWRSKLDYIRSTQVRVFSRPLRYSEVERVYQGISTVEYVPREKGVDVRMALDIVRFALESQYDAAVIFSQDQDLSEAVDDVHVVARQQGRNIKLACAYPDAGRQRGINKTDWLRIPKAEYDRCIDLTDHHSRADAQVNRRRP